MKTYRFLNLCAMGFSLMCGCVEPSDNNTPQTEIPLGFKPGTRLSPKLFLADDGTMFFNSTQWMDSEYGPCRFRVAADGQYRCLPDEPEQTIAHYSDASCAQRAFLYSPTGMCQKPDKYVLTRVKDDVCGVDERWAVFRITASATQGSIYHFQDNNLCGKLVTINTAADGTIMVMGEEIAPTEFVSAWR